MKKIARQILKDARKRIAKGWCRRSFSRTIAGKEHVCAGQALAAASGRLKLDIGHSNLRRAFTDAREALIKAIWDYRYNCNFDSMNSNRRIIDFNDSHTKRQVLRAFDRAIASLE